MAMLVYISVIPSFSSIPHEASRGSKRGAWEVVGCPHGKKPRDIPSFQALPMTQKLEDMKKGHEKSDGNLGMAPSL